MLYAFFVLIVALSGDMVHAALQIHTLYMPVIVPSGESGETDQTGNRHIFPGCDEMHFTE